MTTCITKRDWEKVCLPRRLWTRLQLSGEMIYLHQLENYPKFPWRTWKTLRSK